MPTDLAALQADDALLDSIGSGAHIPTDSDDELTRVLSAWRREANAEPVKELVDTSTAMAVIRAAARRPAHRRTPLYGTAAAAAAVLVIAFSGVGLVAKSAQPGDQLWGVTQVLYGDYARSVETAAAVRTELNEAKVALNQGHTEQARAALAHVQQQLPVIGESEGLTDLTARHRQLEQRLNEPETSQPKPPENPAVVPSMPNGDKTGVTTPADPNGSSARATTTTPSTTREMPPGMSGTSPYRFMPGTEDYRRYRSGAGAPGSPGSPGSSGSPGSPGQDGQGGQDGQDDGSSGSGTHQGVPADDNTGRGGAAVGSDAPTSSSGPEGHSTPSTGPDASQVGPRPPGPSGSFSSFCDHAVPRPRFCH